MSTMPKRPRRRRDPNELAYQVYLEAIGEAPPSEPEPEMVAAEPDYEDADASEELVAALAAGQALTFEPDLDEDDDLLPGARAARAEASLAEPAEAEATPDDIAAELAREAAEKNEDAAPA